MQRVTPTGPNGKEDYSNWTYTYSKKYHEIIEGQNELTSKITCVNGAANASTKYYSINVTGVKKSSDNNAGNDSKGIEDQNFILPTSSNHANNQNTSYKILPLYKSGNNGESGQVSAHNSGDTQLLSSEEDKPSAVQTTQDKSSANDNTQLLSSEEDKPSAVQTTQDKSSANDNTQLLSSEEDKPSAVQTTQDKSSANDNTQLLSSEEDKPSAEVDKSSANDNTQLLSSDEDKSTVDDLTQLLTSDEGKPSAKEDKSSADHHAQLFSSDQDRSDKSSDDNDIFDFKFKYNDDFDDSDMKDFNGLLHKYINDKVKHIKENIMGMD
jgi:hypothetical protein